MKRRSKKDQEGRSFKCDKCDKTYLSYPALYTHTKIKHSEGVDGKPVLPVFSGRGRGRPRKNNAAKVDPTSEEFFKSEEKLGGPVDPYSGIEEEVKYFDDYELPGDSSEMNMMKYLKKFQECFASGTGDSIPQDARNTTGEEEIFTALIKPGCEDFQSRDYSTLNDSIKSTMCCDEVFALYLYVISKQVNSEFYKTAVKFIL